MSTFVFDASTMIAKFSADESQTSLEMPHMTTGQRKHAKKLLEVYPEIRCESYGFGAERCLHLFKENHADAEAKAQSSASPLAISSSGMKNTFTEVIVSSEQESMITRSSQACSEEISPKVATVVELSSQTQNAEDSVGGSTSMSVHASSTSSDIRPELILPLTQENLQVRNTFIHMCPVSADERAVQSMPHGMFKQCLLSEAAEAFEGTLFCNTPTSAGGDSPSFCDSDVDADHCGQRLPLDVGSLVLVQGLVKLPAYNGRSAVVEAWDEATERYCILIACPSGCLQAKVKEENLRMIMPCPR